ncbi:MAG: cysteine desulfurase [Sandaracinaceae bacterium]|nr:cysteine desulfurase [Sandaracinaceae bacterium]
MPIYCDHHATTPVDERVLDAMLPYLRETFGNAASRGHAHGRAARDAVEGAREQVASLLGARAREIIFTSGATESDNLALLGVMCRSDGSAAGHLVTQATEHPAVLDTCDELTRRGARVTRLPVDPVGRVSPSALADGLDEDTRLVSVMLCNNEVGTVQDINALARVERPTGALFHCDAAQGLGLLPLDVGVTPVDLVSVSAHKLYGPKGVGALYVRASARPRLRPVVFGGGHEDGLRSGTANVPGIVGLGAAAQLAREEGASDALRIARLRDRLWASLSELEEVRRFGDSAHAHPGNLCVGFGYTDAAALLLALEPHVSVASGAACSTHKSAPSHVLMALGVTGDWLRSSVRFGLGRSTTESEVDEVASHVKAAVGALRARSPLFRARGTPLDW